MFTPQPWPWLALFGVACVQALPVPYVVRDLRVIAVVIEPPEVALGERVRVTTYFAGAAGPVLARVGRCADGGYACEALTVLADGMAHETEPGVWRFDAEVVADGDTFLVRGDDGVAPRADALKRVQVSTGDSTGDTRNRNPAIDGAVFLTVDGLVVEPPLVSGQVYRVLPLFQPEVSQEMYTRVYAGGMVEEAQEEAIFTWQCADDCVIESPLSYGFQSVRVTPRGDLLRLFLVLRDARGGQAFARVDAAVAP